MAITYSGSRPVVAGRSTSDFVHPYKGLGTYSNWSIFAGNGPLSGMPENEDHVPGTGRHPHDVQMTRRFLGTDFDSKPMEDPGRGAELTWHHKITDVWAKQGEGAQDVFSDFGHEDRVTSYSLWNSWIYRGTTPAPLRDPGHEVRGLNDEGTANWFGAKTPWIYKGVTPTPLNDAGTTIDDKPAGLDSAFQKVNEWKGVPSARAL